MTWPVAGISASIEAKSRIDKTIELGLAELKYELRPKLASDPRYRASLTALDSVLRNATPVPPAKTFWSRIQREGNGSLQRLWAIIRGK